MADVRVDRMARAFWNIERRFDPPDPMPGFYVGDDDDGDALPWHEQNEQIREWCRRRAAELLAALDETDEEVT
jgi:hypothetical protein